MRIQLNFSKKTNLIGLLFILGLITLSFVPAFAQTPDEDVRIEVESGFDDRFKIGEWMPLQIIATNEGHAVDGKMQVTFRAPITGQEVIYSTTISLPTNSSKRLQMILPPPQYQQTLTINLLDEDGTSLAQVHSNQLYPLAQDALLYGIISSAPETFDISGNVISQQDETAVTFLDLQDLPDNPIALNALDILIIDDVDTSRLNSSQLSALNNWVSTGGQLVVSGGPNWQKSSAAFISELPVRVTGSKTLAEMNGLQAWGAAPFRNPGPYVVSEGHLQEGEVLIEEQGLPILARRPSGSGAYYYLALDPKLAPLANWGGQALIWEEVAKRVPAPLPWDGGFQNSHNTSSAVSNIPNVKLPSFSFILGFLLIYVIIIGPLNFLVLNKLGRRELAWITIPLGVLFFCGAAYLLGNQFLGQGMVINQISLVTGHLEGDNSRVRSVIGMYAPYRESFSLMLPEGTAVRPAENFQGGDEPASLMIIDNDQATEIAEFHANAGDLFPFQLENQLSTPPLLANIQLHSENDQIILEAIIENQSALDFADVALLIGNLAVPLGDLPVGHKNEWQSQLNLTLQEGSDVPLFTPNNNLNSPLVANSDVLAGSLDLLEDAFFTRRQLLQAVDGGHSGSQPDLDFSGNEISLIAWSEESHLIPHMTKDLGGQTTTLYIFQLPLSGDQNLIKQLLQASYAEGN